jgi:hypothetical protein
LENWQATGYCIIGKQARNAILLLVENRQEMGNCYFWNTEDANVCDKLIGLLWETVIIGI